MKGVKLTVDSIRAGRVMLGDHGKCITNIGGEDDESQSHFWNIDVGIVAVLPGRPEAQFNSRKVFGQNYGCAL